MTWSRSDHHRGEATMTSEFRSDQTCGRSPYHPGFAWMTSKRSLDHGGKAAMTWSLCDHHNDWNSRKYYKKMLDSIEKITTIKNMLFFF
jgi:hypothetical protein